MDPLQAGIVAANLQTNLKSAGHPQSPHLATPAGQNARCYPKALEPELVHQAHLSCALNPLKMMMSRFPSKGRGEIQSCPKAQPSHCMARHAHAREAAGRPPQGTPSALWPVWPSSWPLPGKSSSCAVPPQPSYAAVAFRRAGRTGPQEACSTCEVAHQPS